MTTPYPGTEIWQSEQRRLTSRDYRLFDIQHAVLPTALPLAEFYAELVKTQRVLARKHMSWAALRQTAGIAAGHLLHGQTNFVRMLWKFDSVYDPELQLADHARPVVYEIPTPHAGETAIPYVHAPRGRRDRALDPAAERLVEATRIG